MLSLFSMFQFFYKVALALLLMFFLVLPSRGQTFKSTPTGLEYRLISKGKGEAVKASHRLFLRYSTQINQDTALFDASPVDAPYAFIVGEAEGLKGWDEGLLLLHVGDSAVFRIPSALGFGAKKTGRIPANATLLFSVRVLAQQEAFFNLSKSKRSSLDTGLSKFLIKPADKGAAVEPFCMLSMNFTGYIKDEQGHRRIFESSLTNSAKAVFQLGTGRMLPGLEKGLATMRVGEKATFEMAPQLGFGDKKKGSIPPNSTLYFDIELCNAYSPFFSEQIKDTIYGFKQLKIIKQKTTSGPFISADQVVKLNCITYRVDAAGHKLLLNNSLEAGEALTIRAGAPVKNMGLNLGLPYLRKGERATIIVPASEETGNIRDTPVNRFYHDVEILDVLPYPFFKTEGTEMLDAGQDIKYFRVRTGDGPAVAAGKKLSFAYTGYYLDAAGRNVIFDASRESGRLLVFERERSQVIPGFELGTKGMLVGEARKIIIPPGLAYGAAGVPKSGIPPNTTLIFDVELIQID